MFDTPMVERVGFFIVLLLSLTVHEWAHALSAFKLGDDTAARMGRLTLSPLAHIDPIGTVLLPLLGIPFGWAKPVPVVSSRFRRDISMGAGMAITAGAGPLSNLVLALVCAVVTGVIHRFYPRLWADEEVVRFLLLYGFHINVLLALFNMLPVPPLDGSRVVDGLLPYRFRPQWESFVRFAPLILVVILVAPFAGFSVLSGPLMLASELRNGLVEFIYTLGR